MYDIIGDIHGHATELKWLLEKLGYGKDGDIWYHPQRKVVFLGDFVDRGPEQVETVTIVRTMLEAGQALAIMGNHEFNAVAWSMPNPQRPGHYLREHSAKNLDQHRAFLKQTGEGSPRYRDFIDWFKTLPLFIELEGFRVIHACWHNEHLRRIRPYLDADNRILSNAWPELADEDSPGFESLETLIKGLQVELPAGVEFLDEAGHARTEMRTEWWNMEGITYRDLARVPGSEIEKIPHEPIPEDILPVYDREKPLFVGHYWMEHEPEPLNDHIACLDYSIAGRMPNRKLCAYRWNGEKQLSRDNFVWVKPRHY